MKNRALAKIVPERGWSLETKPRTGRLESRVRGAESGGSRSIQPLHVAEYVLRIGTQD
jgi:hypothetical protein